MDYSTDTAFSSEPTAIEEQDGPVHSAGSAAATEAESAPTVTAIYLPPERHDRSTQEYPFFPAFESAARLGRRARRSAEAVPASGSSAEIGRDELFYAFLDLPMSAWTSSRNH